MKKLARLLRIKIVFLRYQLDALILALPALEKISWLQYLNPYRYFGRYGKKDRGERLRLTLEALGPIFVKFGQILSTRRDLLPDDIAAELVLLQDSVPPFPGEQAKIIIEQALGTTIEAQFSDFSLTPLASASIAQVHAAKLPDGKDVVIKVLRPDIEKIIKRDIALLYSLAKLMHSFIPSSRRFRPIAVVTEFEHSLIDELDLMREAANGSQLRRNFQNSRDLYVPEMHWPYCRKNIIVMERIAGIPVADISRLQQEHFNLKKLAERGVAIFFTQVFRDCFFHADMHAGNIFVAKDNKEDPKYIAVDFGIMGTLSPADQHYLAANLLAFFHRDYRRVAELHVESGWVPSGTRVEAFESAIRSVSEPIFERPLKDISFGYLLLHLFQTARRFHMEVQPQLILLQKTLLNIEGLGRQLYPDLNLWETAKPFLEKWMRSQVGLKALIKKTRKQSPFWLAKLADMPELVLNKLEEKQEKSEETQQQLQLIHRLNQRVYLLSITIVALLLLLFFR